MNRIRGKITASAMIAACLLGGGEVVAEQEADGADKSAFLEAFLDPVRPESLELLKRVLPKDGEYYIVDGDILYTEEQLRVYLLSMRTMQRAEGTELIVATDDGARVYWNDVQDRSIPYVVDRSSFPDEDMYVEIVKYMNQATADWEAACLSCGIDFIHMIERDVNPVIGDGVTFVVRFHDVKGQYIAAAFFPNDAESRRFINIDPSFFSTTFSQVGVLRHELGHVLGYRHEHIQGIPGCGVEDNEWVPLTEYDHKSVMHYLCGSGGDRELAITETDKAGHQLLYGRLPE